jgi:hypothetical protein
MTHVFQKEDGRADAGESSKLVEFINFVFGTPFLADEAWVDYRPLFGTIS